MRTLFSFFFPFPTPAYTFIEARRLKYGNRNSNSHGLIHDTTKGPYTAQSRPRRCTTEVGLPQFLDSSYPAK